MWQHPALEMAGENPGFHRPDRSRPYRQTYSAADRHDDSLLEASPDGAPPADGFLIVVRRSAVLVLRSMFSFDIAFGHMLCSFVEDTLC